MSETATPEFDVKVELTFPAATIAGLICNAIDTGEINYWCDTISPAPWESKPAYEEFLKALDLGRNYPLPLIPGCALCLTETEGDDGEPKQHRLDRDAVVRGLKAIQKYPHHLRDIIDENADVTTGDVFLQCCIFGEVKYG